MIDCVGCFLWVSLGVVDGVDDTGEVVVALEVIWCERDRVGYILGVRAIRPEQAAVSEHVRQLRVHGAGAVDAAAAAVERLACAATGEAVMAL